MTGLRARKKAATMRHIRQTAIRLFRNHGFDQVTVEQVAATAEVSCSSIYRYFGTKEGLVLRDEYDDRFFAVLVGRVRAGTPVVQAAREALESIADQHFGSDREDTAYRTDLWLTHRGIRAAAALYLQDVTHELAQVLAETGCYTPAEARFVVSALGNGLFTGVANWHADGAKRPVTDYLTEGITALTRAMNEG